MRWVSEPAKRRSTAYRKMVYRAFDSVPENHTAVSDLRNAGELSMLCQTFPESGAVQIDGTSTSITVHIVFIPYPTFLQ